MKAILFLIYVLSLNIFMVSPFLVEGVSMEPNLHPGELFLIDENVRSADDIARGDVIVFALPEQPDYFYVKRVICLPGEKVRLEKEGVSVNKGDGFHWLEESYLPNGSESSVVTGAYKEGYAQTYSVPDGSFFVLGDNRGQSLDSRYFDNPYISLSDIRGKFLINLYQYEEN